MVNNAGYLRGCGQELNLRSNGSPATPKHSINTTDPPVPYFWEVNSEKRHRRIFSFIRNPLHKMEISETMERDKPRKAHLYVIRSLK